jgi:hypothetical protein
MESDKSNTLGSNTLGVWYRIKLRILVILPIVLKNTNDDSYGLIGIEGDTNKRENLLGFCKVDAGKASPAPVQSNSPTQRNGKPTERWLRKALGSKAEYFSYDSLLPK